MSAWTNEHRIAFDEMCQTPLFQAAMAEIERRIQVRPPPQPIAPGYDELVLGSGQYHRAIGHREVMDHIEEMRKEPAAPRRTLPPPNTAEALTRKP